MAALLWALACARESSAQPLRLRADAFVDTSAPAGLVVLSGEDRARPWLQIESLVWAGARTDAAADVLVLSAKLRDPRRRAELHVGRFVFSAGAIRPVQIDGAAATTRLPSSFGVTTLELFGGAPVAPRLGARPYDWTAGGRVAQAIASRVTAGASFVERRADGSASGEEVGADLAIGPLPWLDLAAQGAYDLVTAGVVDARASAAARDGLWRFELFGSHRSPARLLPATSLFSVLGDFPSDAIGSTVRWRAAPRLDLLTSGAGQAVGGELGYNGWLRALLRLDDRGDANVGLELRRQDAGTARWTGIRVIAAAPLSHGLRASTELEIVVPDSPARGAIWPWALWALGWKPAAGWEVAAAAEAASTAEHRAELNAIARLSRMLEVTP
jgi:hypothetical protein